jgi:predicted component of type VI protein secretion system
VLRTNHVAFSEEEADENLSVSRRHAHIAFDEGAYRIWDDRSARGTSIVRGGRTVRVPASARGTRLVSGDEIVLGRARLRVAID